MYSVFAIVRLLGFVIVEQYKEHEPSSSRRLPLIAFYSVLLDNNAFKGAYA